MHERRRVPRTRIYKGAKISMNGPLGACIVRDISSLGARIAIMNACSMPDRFSLTFDVARTIRACRVAWRSSNQLGVEFYEEAFRAA